MSLSPTDKARRRRARRINQQLKISATFLNNLGVGTMVGAILLPIAADKPLPGHVFVVWTPVAFALHLMAHLLLGTMYESEDRAMDNCIVYGWPVAAPTMAGLIFGICWFQSRRFDRDFGPRDQTPPAGE